MGSVPADFSQVERVLALMRQDEQLGWVIEDQFGSLCQQVYLGSFLRKDPANLARLRQNHGRLRPLLDDRMLLFGALLRTALDFERRTDGKLDDGLWFQFSRQDIEFFFLVMRSAMDHAASFIVSAAATKDWIELDSFETLRNKCTDEQNATKALGADWVRLIRAAEWFDDFRTWRLQLAHEGAMTITFFDAETIPFQIHQNGEHKVSVPEVMYNEMVVDFTRFAALYLELLSE